MPTLPTVLVSNSIRRTVAWMGGILGCMPFQYGIKDVNKRVIEYTLGLNVNTHIAARESLRTQKESITQKWYAQLNAADELSRMYTGQS